MLLSSIGKPVRVVRKQRVVLVGRAEDLDVVAGAGADREAVGEPPLVLDEAADEVALHQEVDRAADADRQAARDRSADRRALNGRSLGKVNVPFRLPYSCVRSDEYR